MEGSRANWNANISVSSTSVNTNKQDQFLGSNDFILVSDKKHTNTVTEWVRKKWQKTCCKNMLYRRTPILTWLPQYDKTCAIGDLIAGITIGLTVIPQALAVANIAGLPPEYGLYSSFLGSFIYIVFGSCKEVAMGPSAMLALLTFQSVNNKGPQHAILLCFLTGIIQILMGLCGLGFLIDFISGPVASGFTSAVAIIIVTSQVKDVLAIKASGKTFVGTWKNIIKDIHNASCWDAILGVTCLAVLLMLRFVENLSVKPLNKGVSVNKFYLVAKKTLWLIGISRNVILVIVCGCIGYSLNEKGAQPFKLTGYVPEGFPKVQPPPFSYSEMINGTETTQNVVTMVSDLGSGIIIVPLLALLEDIAVCKVFANGKIVDPTQELLAIGLSNLANSFVQGFPGTGALARSAVNHSSGVKTPLGGLYTGVLVITALFFFTPYFYYIPKPTLAAIIIAAAIFMVEVKVIKPMWRVKKSDLVPGLATFIGCLILPLEYGILIGVGINVMFILHQAARPKISVKKITSSEGVNYLLLTPDRCLIFPSVDYVRNLVNKQSIRQGTPVVIDCSHIFGADYTAATVIKILTQDFAARQQPLFFFNLKPSVCSVFDGLSPKEFTVYYNGEEFDEMLRRWASKRRNLDV